MNRVTSALDLLKASHFDREEFARRIEEVAPAERIAITEGIDGKGQALLWNATEGRGVTIDELVPRELGPLRPVIYHGKNSLPAFSLFQKRFCRPSANVSANELWGYNYQPTRWLAPLTGPGYFVAYDTKDGPGQVAIDYRRIPPSKPDSWPEIHDNRYRLSRFIYNGTVDYLRRVSDHLLIGRATRDGRDMPNYFLLCRADPI